MMRIVALGLAVLCLAGCGRSRTRSPDEILIEKRGLPRLFLSAKTHTRVIAPKSKGMFTDPATGEECWPALECTNPDCPGRHGDEPALFISYDVSASQGCPACAKKRNVKTESASEKARYLKFVQPYELPEVRERLLALEEEYKLANQNLRSGN
jgi:hypothetical protein